LLLILLFGIIDAGRWLWENNRAEKATQAGARVAVVTQIIPAGLEESFVGRTVNGVVLTQGDVVPASALGAVVCQKPANGTLGCTCSTCSGVTLTPIDQTGWDQIMLRMKSAYPNFAEENLRVEYRGSGLGFAGDPSGLDLSPLVTVRLQGVEFQPITTFLLTTINMPEFVTTLTAEDSVGTISE
jgi:Flp pilus assembly protein TadG